MRPPRAMGILSTVLAAVALSSCASTAPRARAGDSGRGQGIASYYGRGFQGKKTASGERYNMHALTAAHRTLPFGTKVRVTNLDNGKSVVVRINDRGPWKKGRIIDVSREAARRLDMIRAGTARVRVETLR